ncbi:MAG: RNase H family protein [Erysipelotrichaceae bacterium]|nr:RNase H family protein [Erysipelotrichaceae bacterium]MDP3305574.1 RNase H family protein [Erysipelotrichaceae bacterium]
MKLDGLNTRPMVKKNERPIKIYVDGSYNPLTNVIGCAFALFDETSKRPYRVAFGKKLKSQVNYGSSIAEMIAVMTAIKAACSLCYSHIIICHDWDGVAHFSKCENIKSRHKTCPKFGEYAKYVDKARKSINIEFVQVKAHSDDELNCLVDQMAKSRAIAYSSVS